MADGTYLYRVLGLSALPRLLTFGLTLVSFPLMLRGMGAAEYGVMVYLTSVMAILELGAGFGVGAAVGKGMAECRARNPSMLVPEFGRWLRLLGLVCMLSAGPVLGAGWLFLHLAGNPGVPTDLYLLVVANLYVSVGIGFGRTVLSSLLAFRKVALLDAVESTLRSAGWLWVGLVHPTVWALACVGMVGSLVTVAVCILLLRPLLRRNIDSPGAASATAAPWRLADLRPLLRESTKFLALTAGTRVFGSLPVLLIGRQLGFEATGLLGAFAKVVEVSSLPFTVIGNAMMVRAPEIKRLGAAALARYWDMLCRLCVVALAVAACALLISAEGALLLLPGSAMARETFFLLPVLLLARSVSDLFAPASDYVGGLRPRILFLWVCALLQLPLIAWGATVAQSLGAVGAMVGAYVAMVVGYLFIARQAFFEGQRYRPPPDSLVGAAAAVVVAIMASLAPVSAWLQLALFAAALLIVFGAAPMLRRAFLPHRLIRFDFA